ENRALRAFLKLPDDARGVLVVPPRTPPAGYALQELDLLTRIGSYDIDNEGMIHLPDGLRAPFPSAIPRLAKNPAVPVPVARGGERVEESLAVGTAADRLIRDYRGEKPSYFIHGPLVFSPAKADALGLYARGRPILDAANSPLFARAADRMKFPGEELVVVTSPLFAHNIARGDGAPFGQVVAEVHGTKVRNLARLIAVLRAA